MDGSSNINSILPGNSNVRLTSPSNQLGDDKDIELQDVDGSLGENVESCLSHDYTDPRYTVGPCMDQRKGLTFSDVNSVCASTSKILCSHFSSDGKLLATGGLDEKVVLWYTDSLQRKATLEQHSSLITDVRFSPSMSHLATSSFDKTVRVWDVNHAEFGFSLRTFTGHPSAVLSVDFHPNMNDLICCCDARRDIRYWILNNGSCASLFKGGSHRVRFQPRLGRYLAAAAGNIVSIFDVETQACLYSLKGHERSVFCLCWDPSGELLASVSADSVRVWTLRSGSQGECVHQLISNNGKKFHACVFHPMFPQLLVIGCYQSLELWNMTGNKIMTLPAHDDHITTLAVSSANGLVASASHDKFIKLWGVSSK